jgi:hypothetical protein
MAARAATRPAGALKPFMEAAPVKRGLVGVEVALPVGEPEPEPEPLLDEATTVLEAVLAGALDEAEPEAEEEAEEVRVDPGALEVVDEPQLVGEPWKASIPFWIAAVMPAESWEAML